MTTPIAGGAGYRFDLGGEPLLDCAAIGSLIAKITGQKEPGDNQVRRWFATGVRGIPLPSVLVCGKRYGSERGVRWWIEQTTRAANQAPGPSQRSVSP